MQEGSFVGVVCQTEWAAVKAAKSAESFLVRAGDQNAGKLGRGIYLLKNTKSLRDQVTVNKGDPDKAIGAASKTYEATYRWPFQMHGMMGPSCSVADVGKDQATIYSGTQGSFETRKAVADLLGLPEKSVRVLYREASGSYGRMGADDVSEDAALLSRAVGKPVRVQWMRDDEHGWEPKGPAQLDLVRAGVDAQGKIVGWDFADRGLPLTAASGRGLRLLASRQIGMKSTADGNSNGTRGGGEMYAFENQKCAAPLIPWVQADETPLRTGYLRAPGDIARCFASESFIDEIAADQRVDPVQFRMRYLGANKRGADALAAVVKQAKWQERPSPAAASSGSKATGRGVAISNRAETICGAVAEVEVDKTSGNVAVKRFILSHDCGLIINPDGLKNQIEGNIIQGVSRALMEEVKFDSTGIKTLDWNSYDADVAAAERQGGLHELALAQRQHSAAHDPRVDDPRRHADHDDDRLEARPQHADDRDGEQDERKRQLDVGQPHEHVVRAPAEVAGDQPGRHPDQPGDRDRREADQQGRAGAVDHARQQVAAEVIGAERVHAPGRVAEARRLEPQVAEVLLDRIERRQERRGQRGDDHHHHDDEAEQRGAPRGEAAQEHEPLPPPDRRSLRQGDDVALLSGGRQSGSGRGWPVFGGFRLRSPAVGAVTSGAMRGTSSQADPGVEVGVDTSTIRLTSTNVVASRNTAACTTG